MRKSTICVVLSILFVFVLAGATAGLAATKVKLATPELLTPGNKTVLTNLPRNTTLAWSPVDLVVTYTVTLEFSPSGDEGTYSPVGAFTGTGILPAQLSVELTDTQLAADGFYKWTVQAIAGSGISNSNVSKPAFFQYHTTKTLKTPTLITPPNGQVLLTPDRIQTLAWDSRPAVVNGAPNGYNVYIETKTGLKTWSAPTIVPVSTTSGFNWQNSSLTFTAPAVGTYRWAVQAVGDGVLALDSPPPSDSKSKDWWEFTFDTP
ncbi:MAG: hypothetical protein ABSF90_01565 [Syntrophobacteraceae bacterium]|jgi:hypothetical protein